MDGKDATTAPPGAPQPGEPPSSPLTQQAMDGKDAAASSPQPGEPQPAEWTASRGDQELPPPDEHLKKTFACYLSTATGPVAGTLYLTNMNVAFCSDRPLSFAAPSGQTAWSYYKVVIPLARIASVEPVTAKENPPERYVHVLTVDSHDFWFMGFVSYDKAVHHLGSVVSSQHAAAPPTPAASYQ
ncbi:unnamed protein product [Alopecurus aequalis]